MPEEFKKICSNLPVHWSSIALYSCAAVNDAVNIFRSCECDKSDEFRLDECCAESHVWGPTFLTLESGGKWRKVEVWPLIQITDSTLSVFSALVTGRASGLEKPVALIPKGSVLGWRLSLVGYTISMCNQLARWTQPYISPGLLNWVVA